MNTDVLDHLKALHTSAIDARNGYREALKDADGKGMTPLFREMMTLHDGNAGELARELIRANEIPDEKGSFMTVIHETIMDMRSLFNGLDDSVLPGLIDGEKRNVSKYDEALKETKATPDIAGLLTSQREKIVQKIAAMETQKAAGEHAASLDKIDREFRDSRSIEMCDEFLRVAYFGMPVEPFSLPTPVSDDVGAERVSGAGLAG